MHEIKFRAIGVNSKKWVYGMTIANGTIKRKKDNLYFEVYEKWIGVMPETLGQYTGYKMYSKDVFFGDLVSNNFKTDKEVIRQIVMHKGSIMMKIVKGKSTLAKHLSLHEWRNMNFKVIGNIHEDKELLK